MSEEQNQCRRTKPCGIRFKLLIYKIISASKVAEGARMFVRNVYVRYGMPSDLARRKP